MSGSLVPPKEDGVTVSHEALRIFFKAILSNRNVRDDVSDHVCESLLQTSLRGVDSHGIELFPHYIRAIDAGRINPNPRYAFEMTGDASGRFDADHTFGHAAGAEAMGKAVQLAQKSGLGAVAVYNSTHFGAAAYFAFLASKQGMIGMSFTHADALMLSYGGVRPFFGTNPICFAAPCDGEEDFCLDMATSLASWNKLRRRAEEGMDMPSTWAVDANGDPTTSPGEARALAPIGEYKGFGLSMMVEVLCGLLTGMPFGRNICRMYADPIEQKRLLGHFFMALDIAHFTEVASFKKRMKALMDQVRSEPPKDHMHPVLVPGDPEKKAHSRRIHSGIPVSRACLEAFLTLARETGIPVPSSAM